MLAEVAGEEAPASKVEIGALIMKTFKEQKTGNVKFTFRTPIMDGVSLSLCVSSCFFVRVVRLSFFCIMWACGWVGGRLGV